MSKILVPFPKNDRIDFYLKNNIDAFLIGVKDHSENFENLVDIDKLEEIIEKLKKENKEVYICLNKVVYNNEIQKLKTSIEKINKLNIDGLFFSDYSVLNIINDNNYNINLYWFANHLGCNSKTINFLEKRNVVGVFLSDEITTNEKINIINNIKIKSFVTGFGYTNMATSSRKLITNYFKHCNINKEPGKKYYIKEKNSQELFPIIESDNTNFFSNKIFNGLLEYRKLHINCNLDYIYLNDYMIGKNVFFNVIEAFNAIDNHFDDEEFANKLKSVIDTNCSDNTDDGFSNKKTIYRVKKYE